MTTERDPFERLSLDDPQRPIKILGTVEAVVPEASKRFLSHVVDEVEFPNGNRGWHHRIKLPEGVMLAHVNDNEQIGLVQNYRHPIGRYSVELPSGALDPTEEVRLTGASPEERDAIFNEAARREFEEEMGWRLGSNAVRRLLQGPLQGSVGFADQTYNVFFGEGGIKARQNLDDGEHGLLTYDRHSIDDAIAMVGHEIVDPATSASVMGLGLIYGKNIPYFSNFRKNK